MTEADWLAGTDPTPMLAYLRGLASDRKLRLFAVGCCRRLWHLMGERATSKAIETAEDLADGAVSEWKLRSIRSDLATRIRHAGDWIADRVLFDLLDQYAGVAAQQAMSSILWFQYPFASEGLRHSDVYQAAKERDADKQGLIGFLGDIFGNPFRPVAFDPAWRSETAVALAAGIYAERAFDRLPILADALEEAGCDQPDILAHCRGDGPHVRGCWVVDGVLGMA